MMIAIRSIVAQGVAQWYNKVEAVGSIKAIQKIFRRWFEQVVASVYEVLACFAPFDEVKYLSGFDQPTARPHQREYKGTDCLR